MMMRDVPNINVSQLVSGIDTGAKNSEGTWTIKASRADLFRFYLEVEEEFNTVLVMSVEASQEHNRTASNVSTRYTKTPAMLK